MDTDTEDENGLPLPQNLHDGPPGPVFATATVFVGFGPPPPHLLNGHHVNNNALNVPAPMPDMFGPIPPPPPPPAGGPPPANANGNGNASANVNPFGGGMLGGLFGGLGGGIPGLPGLGGLGALGGPGGPGGPPQPPPAGGANLLQNPLQMIGAAISALTEMVPFGAAPIGAGAGGGAGGGANANGAGPGPAAAATGDNANANVGAVPGGIAVGPDLGAGAGLGLPMGLGPGGDGANYLGAYAHLHPRREEALTRIQRELEAKERDIIARWVTVQPKLRHVRFEMSQGRATEWRLVGAERVSDWILGGAAPLEDIVEGTVGDWVPAYLEPPPRQPPPGRPSRSLVPQQTQAPIPNMGNDPAAG